METPPLTRRPFTEGDIPFVLKAWNDERVTALVGETMTEQQVRERIERWSRHRAIYGCGTELFYDRSTAQPIGWGRTAALHHRHRRTTDYQLRRCA